MSKVQLNVKVVPADGDIKTTSHEIEVEPTGVQLRDALKAAGVDVRKMQVTVDGRIVTDLDAYVIKGAKIQVSPKPVEVACTERASGS